MKDLYELPHDLPVPVDDAAAAGGSMLHAWVEAPADPDHALSAGSR